MVPVNVKFWYSLQVKNLLAGFTDALTADTLNGVAAGAGWLLGVLDVLEDAVVVDLLVAVGLDVLSLVGAVGSVVSVFC